jgi:Amidohydrolase
VCWESDYPHSDSSWPEAPEKLWALVADLDEDVVDHITHRNAMKHYQFDPFAIRTPEQCTAGALRAEASDVDTVTHVGRLADESDRAAWRQMTGAAAAAAAKS